MRKLPGKFENPIDHLLISHIDSIKSHFYKLGFTPNILTTFSLLSHLLSMYFFVNNQKYYTVYSVIFFGLAYYFDCFDGHFARSYNMVTIFGDYYDHVSDWFKGLLFFWLIYVYFKPYFYVSMAALMSVGFLTMIHMSCQENYYSNYGDTSDTLHLLTKYMCPTHYFNVDIGKCLNITKYFGCGTYILVSILVLIYLKTRTKHRNK